MMRYSIEPRDRIFVKDHEFLSFTKNMGKNLGKNIKKSLSEKYSQNLRENAKKSTRNAIKTASKKAIQHTTKAAGDLIDKKIADKI